MMNEITPRDRREAEKWVVRMLDDPERHRSALSRWMLAKAGRRALYDRIFSSVEDAALAAPENRQHKASGLATTRSWWRLQSVAALFVAFLCASAVWFWIARTSPASHGSIIASGANGAVERLLPGGIMLMLDADSRIRLDGSAGGQIITLERGRIRLTVPQQDATNLVIKAADSELATASGSFDVSLRDRLVIEMRAGSLTAHAASWRDRAGRALRFRLHRGERLAFAGNSTVPAVSRYRPDEDQWGSGIKSFEDVPISAVIDEANSYSATRIILADPALGTRRIFGDIHVRDGHAAARALAGYLGGEVDRSVAGYLTIRT